MSFLFGQSSKARQEQARKDGLVTRFCEVTGARSMQSSTLRSTTTGLTLLSMDYTMTLVRLLP